MVANTPRMTTELAGAGRERQRWREWAPYAAGAWSLGYGLLGLYWTLGGAGFPFGREHDPEGAAVSLLAGVRPETGAPVIAALGLIGAAVALAMARTRQRHWPLLGFAWAAAGVLLFVVPDFRALAAVAYAPLIPFLGGDVPWPIVNQLIGIAGGMVWGLAAVTYQRRTRAADADRSKSDAGSDWTTPAAAARWGRWATYVAVAVPIVYAATRWAWALGIPFGVSREFLQEMERTTPGIWLAGAFLATLGAGGAALTLGLSQRWGEVFPRWIPVLAGRRVPPALAIIPASFVAVLVSSAGLMFIRQALTGALPDIIANPTTLGPILLWPVWGIALGLATLAYHYRRRGQS